MPTDHIRYDLLVQDALRSVVRKVLADAARNGLPGDHHFNISFKTRRPESSIPAAMRQRYPDEMTIILQHEFWDLTVNAGGFEVNLNFSRKPERLTIPFAAITGFSDPSVPFGFKLEAGVAPPRPRRQPRRLDRPRPAKAGRAPRAPAAPRRQAEPPRRASPPLRPSRPRARPKPAGKAGRRGRKVVSIDAFRKK